VRGVSAENPLNIRVLKKLKKILKKFKKMLAFYKRLIYNKYRCWRYSLENIKNNLTYN